MKEKELKIDRRCHVVYSKTCREEILKKLRLHYEPTEVAGVFEQVQKQYERYLAFHLYSHQNQC